MIYRELGKTGLMVSEIGLGGEWLERHNTEEVKAVIDVCEEEGINILDCWMSEPNVRSNIGSAIKGKRNRWIIQGHIGSIWENGQYVRTRNLKKVKPAFEDLLARLQTDYIDLGMIHFIDNTEEFDHVMNGEFIEYVRQLKKEGKIRHIGMSSHNPEIAKMAACHGEIEMILFSINPAFDLLPPVTDLEQYFTDQYDEKLSGIAPEREELYKICEQNGVGITVMKAFGGGDLLDASMSPAGKALTPVQCIHYALTRPAVATVLAGAHSLEQLEESISYEDAPEAEKDYAGTFATFPNISWKGHCMYCSHCAPCPNKIDVAAVTKFLNLAKAQGEVPETVREHYGALGHYAGECVQCGACETRCPFEVSIIENMKMAKEVFGK